MAHELKDQNRQPRNKPTNLWSSYSQKYQESYNERRKACSMTGVENVIYTQKNEEIYLTPYPGITPIWTDDLNYKSTKYKHSKKYPHGIDLCIVSIDTQITDNIRQNRQVGLYKTKRLLHSGEGTSKVRR